jgi:uncharacterized protein (TIGR02099 family)
MSIVAPVTAAASAPPSRGTIVAARLRWLTRVLAGLVIAACSLLLVAWLTLHWGILPHIQQWRPQIEQRASNALGVPVRIGNISVTSSGWMPTLELQGVTLQDRQSRTALELPRVVASLSPRSLFALELRFEQLLLDGAHLEVRRDRQGRVFVAGLDLSGPGQGDKRTANWFFSQPAFVIRGGSLRWTDEQRAAPPLSLTDVQLVLRNGLRSHEMQLDATPPAQWGERFTLRGRFTQRLLTDSGDWNRWSGRVFAELPRADVSELRRHVSLPFELSEGDGALRAWVDVREGQLEGATVDLALREVRLRLARDVQPLVLEQIQGRLTGTHTDDGWSLGAQQFGFLTGDGIRWPRSDLAMRWLQREGERARGGEFTAQRLDLALMAQIASRVPLGEALRKLLAELDPQGVISDLSTRWSGPLDAPETYHVKGVLRGLSLAAKPAAEPDGIGRPGLRNATIVLDATEKGGDAKLAVVDGGLEFPGVFEEALVPMTQLGGALQWRIEPGRSAVAPARVTLQVKDVKFANADAQGELSGRWSTGAGEGFARGGRYPGLIELNGKVAHGTAARLARYLPLGIPEDTRQYVAHAVTGGRVRDLTLRIRGDLWDFPFHRVRNPKDGEFRLAAHVDDVNLAYVPGVPATPPGSPRGAQPAVESPWPPFTKVSGELIIDRATMEIRNAQARVYGVELSKVQGGIRNLLDRSVLDLEGSARGPLADMLRYVNTSPVGDWMQKALAQATAGGAADLRLALAIPLTNVDRSTVKGSITLAGNDVRITPDTPLLGAAKARVDFTHKGFAIVGGSARVLGGDATFDGTLQPDGSTRISGQGMVTAEGLRRAPELGALSRLAGSLGGQASYRMTLAFARGHPELGITSNLVGLASDLPPPLRKAADAPLPMRYQNSVLAEPASPGQPLRDTLRFELGNLVQAQFVRELSGDTLRVLRGGLGVLDTMPSPNAGVAANIKLPSIDTDAWGAIADKLAAAPAPGTQPSPGSPAGGASEVGGYLPTSVALRAQELLTGGRRLTNVVAGASQDDGLWRANVDAEQLNGYVEYRPARRGASSAAAGRVYARLSRLSLPKSDADSVESLLDQQAASVPALDIVVDELELLGKRLGRVEVEAVNRISGEGREAFREWRLTRLAMTTPEGRFVANGQWIPSPLPSRRRAVLNFKLDLADGGALLDRLGTPKAVKGGKGSLAGQVSWIGSPLSLDYPSLNGQINVAIDSGQFLKVQPGAARLLSVLSLQSLPRRLVLDFRDLFQQGFAFDNITGDVTITQGVAHTNNLRMRGVQAAVLMEGNADIEHETQDLRVIVVPEINAGTASLAYAAINPAIGIGTFLAQVFLRKPLTQAGTREFLVTGTWTDPKVERVQRKFGDPVPEMDAAAGADKVKR